MGMFDYIICRYPLSGTPPDFCANKDHQYQTKSLDCALALYEITETGELRQVGPGAYQKLSKSKLVAFHGVLEFHDSNATAAAFGVSFTPNGEDCEWVAYKASFVDGTVQTIVEVEREREPALAMHLVAEIDAKFDKDKPQVTMTEPEIEQAMYLQWGGSTKGYPVTLLAKTQREWAVADENGRIETLRPSDLGRVLFHSQEESDRAKAWREKTQELKSAYAKSLLLKSHRR